MVSRQLSRQLGPAAELAGLHLGDLGDLVVDRLDEAWSKYPLPVSPQLAVEPRDTEDPETYPRIEWGWRPESADFGYAGPATGDCVGDLVGLADLDGLALNAATLRFVTKWGHLSICAHGILAAGHRNCSRDAVIGRSVNRLDPAANYAGWFDPVAAYRAYARHIRALIRIAMRHQQSEQARTGEWGELAAVYREVPLVTLEAFLSSPPFAEATDELARALTYKAWSDQHTDLRNHNLAAKRMASSPVSLEVEIGWIQSVLSHWWELGHVSVAPGRESSHWKFSGLVGLIAVEVTRRIEGLPQGAEYRCAGCARRFAPTRKPSPGKRTWCEACRTNGTKQRLHKWAKTRAHA